MQQYYIMTNNWQTNTNIRLDRCILKYTCTCTMYMVVHGKSITQTFKFRLRVQETPQNNIILRHLHHGTDKTRVPCVALGIYGVWPT